VISDRRPSEEAASGVRRQRPSKAPGERRTRNPVVAKNDFAVSRRTLRKKWWIAKTASRQGGGMISLIKDKDSPRVL
jgi:hypothetical protein